MDPDRRRFLGLAQQALAGALSGLDARDRLRLSLYYAQGMRLAAIGRVLGESEATASRKLERTRGAVRAAVERQLRDTVGLTDAQIELCFDLARTDPAFDLARALPLTEAERPRAGQMAPRGFPSAWHQGRQPRGSCKISSAVRSR